MLQLVQQNTLQKISSSYLKKYGEPRLNLCQPIYVNNQIAHLNFVCDFN